MQLTDTLHTMRTCDTIIEAVTENQSIKKEIFNELDLICDDDVILASNTSSIPITKIAGWCSPDRSNKVMLLLFITSSLL